MKLDLWSQQLNQEADDKPERLSNREYSGGLAMREVQEKSDFQTVINASVTTGMNGPHCTPLKFA